MNIIFKDNPEVLKALNTYKSIAMDLTPDARTVPKGSADSPMFMKLMESAIMTKVPALRVVSGLARQGADAAQTPRQVREAVSGAIDVADPRGNIERAMIQSFPRLAAAMGISLTAKDKNTAEGIE